MTRDKPQRHNFHLTRRRAILIVAILFALVCIGLIFFTFIQPERSVANFCRVAKEEKPILVGNVNYEKRLESYKKLETVAPEVIRPDISTIRKGYEEIVKSPSNSLSTGLGMSSAESRRTQYISDNCPDF